MRLRIRAWRLSGIETVHRRQQFLCEDTDLLLKDKEDTDVIWLTNREREIFNYIVNGYTTEEIADTTVWDTVKSCRKNLLIKLNAKIWPN